MLQGYFKINSEKLIQEVIEGEVIIIDLEKGHYYSLNEIGADIWLDVQLGLSAENIITKFQTIYGAGNSQVREAVLSLLSELVNEEIIIAMENSDNLPLKKESQPNQIDLVKRKAFIAPVLEKYTDMEDLLLLDPIHDVDEQGWPKMVN